MERSEAHLFEEDDDDLEERNGEDIEGELFGPRSDDGSESPGSLNDFIDEEDAATPMDFLAYAAFDASREEILPNRRRRRVVDSESDSEQHDNTRRSLFRDEEEDDEFATPPRAFSPTRSPANSPTHSPPGSPSDNPRGLLDSLEALERKWSVGVHSTPASALSNICRYFDAEDDFDANRIEAASRRCWAEFASITQGLNGAFTSNVLPPDDRNDVVKRLEAIRSAIGRAKAGLLQFVNPGSTEVTELQPKAPDSVRTELISAWYDRAALYGLRALDSKGCEDFCYSAVKCNGYNTRAFKVETTIQQALFDTCNVFAGDGELYNKLTSTGSFQTDIPAHIAANRNDPRFPVIQKDRHIFAFKNGVYVAWVRPGMLRPGSGLDVGTDVVRDLFIPYEGGRVDQVLQPEVCASKYFDIPFDEVARNQVVNEGSLDWYALHTPNLQQILDAQCLPEEACRWMYAFIGRMLYSVGELDGLQLIVYLKGVAGTGKTLILEKVLKEFYEAEDVGILSNKGEDLFGLSAIYEKNLFFCSEVNHQFNLEQSKFQQMVSGESVSIPIKYKTAVSQPFKPHGFLAGNETFRLKDVSGSLTRRVVSIHFNHPVVNADPDLSKRLKQEVPTIMLKANLAYHWALQQVVRNGRQVDFWSLKIPYFLNTRRQFANSLDPLRGFLSDPGNGLLIASGNLNLYMPLDTLLEKVRSGVGCSLTSAELAQNGIWAEMGLLLFMRTGREVIDPPYPRYTNLRLAKRCWVFGIDALGDDEGEAIPEEGLPAELHEVVAAEYARCFPAAP